LCFYIADHSIIIKNAVHTNLNPNSSHLFITEYVHSNKRFYTWKKVLHSCFDISAGRLGDLTLLTALTGGAFDRLNWQHSGEFDQFFFKKSNSPGFTGGGGMGGFGIDRYITVSWWVESYLKTSLCHSGGEF